MKKQILFLITIALFLSCSKDDDSNTPPKEEDKFKSAILTAIRVNTPNGRLYYIKTTKDIPKVLSAKSMLEVGDESSTVVSYGKHPYVWNGTSSVLTKYNVDKNFNITKGDQLGLSSIGISGFSGAPAFVSDTKAYFFALNFGKIVEFDPTAMEITETINVEKLDDVSGIQKQTYNSFVTKTGKIMLPIKVDYKNNFDKLQKYGQVAVFDTSNNTLTYQKDYRMSMGFNNFAKDGSSGNLFYRSARTTAQAIDYSESKDHPTQGGMLKMTENGEFDLDFFIDFKKILNAHAIASVVYVYGNKALIQYIEKGWEIPKEPKEWYKYPKSYALVNMATKKPEPLSAIAGLTKYGVIYPVGNLNGSEYYGNFHAEDGKFRFLKQTGEANFDETIISENGMCMYIGELK